MKLVKLIKDFKLKAAGRIRAVKYGKTDYGIVKVAFMVAALDGEVSDDELKALCALLKKCRGYSRKTAGKVLDEAMRSAGYLLFLGRLASESALLRAFLSEAEAALPDGFAFLSVEEVRRAVVTWMALGMSDGDYSAREKKCVEALCKRLAELKVARDDNEAETRQMLASSFRQACGAAAQGKMNDLFPRDFMSRVEELVAQYGDRADAAKELEKLIAG